MNPDEAGVTDPPVPRCEVCGRDMIVVRVVPGLGGMRKLETFRCTDCGEVQTFEAK